MFYRLLTYLFTLLFLTPFLTGCLGGGGGSEAPQDSLIDARVATVKVIISNDFQPADGKSAITVTVIAQDAQTASVAGIPVSLFSSSDTAFLEVLSGQTEETGRFTTTVTDSVAEEVHITATAGGVKSSPVNLHFVSSAYDPRVAKLELVVANDFQLADGKSFINFTVVVRDANNTPIPNVQLSLGSASNSASFESVSGKTAQNGRFSTTMTNSVAEKVEVTATAGGKTERTLLTFVSVVNDERVAEVKLTVSNNYQYADGFAKVNLTVIAIDRDGVPLSGVGVSFSSTSASAVFEAFKGRTDDAGRFSTTLTNSIPETIQVTANAGGVRSLPMDVTFISTVGSIFINASAMVLNVGESSKVTVTLLSNLLVNIEDILLGKSLGDFLTDPAVSADTEKAVLDALLERKVLLPQTPFNVVASGTATLSGVTGTTDERGQATFTISDNTAEDVTLTITSGTASQTLILHFGASITLIPTSVNAIGTTKLRALLRDGKKAPLGGQVISFNFNQVTNETLSPVRVVTNLDGTAEITVTDLGNDGGTVIVNANSGSLNTQATVNFLTGQDTLIDERVTTVKVIISDDFQPADGKSLVTVTVIAQDAKTAPVIGTPVSLFSSSDTAFFTALSGQTEETGRFTTTVTNSVAEEVKITATAGGIKSTPVNLHFMAGAVERVTTVKVIISNDFQPADGKSAITVTVIAQDVQSAPVAGIPVSLFTSSDTAFLEALSGPTEETGRFTTTVTDSVAEEVKITATAGGIKSTPVSLHFVSSAYDTRVAKVELVVTNDSQPTDGKSSVTLSVVVRDASNMPIPDVQVYLGSTSNSALFQTVSGKTGENGRFTTTVTDTVAEKVEVTATAGGVKAQTVLTFVSGASDDRVSEVKLTVSNNRQRADGFSKATLTVVVLDQNSLPMSGVAVSLSSTSPSAFLEAVNGVTDEKGHFSTTVTDNIVEDFEVTATAGGKSSNIVKVIFIAEEGVIVLGASEEVLEKGQTTTVTVITLRKVNLDEVLKNFSQIFDVIVIDKGTLDSLLERKILLPNMPFTVASSSATAVLSSQSGITDAYGQARFTVTNTQAEDVTITVTSGAASQTLMLHFGATLTLIPTSINAIGSTPLKVLLRSGNKTPLGGQTVTFNFNQVTNETLSPTSVKTNPDGTAEVTITDLGNDGGTVIINANSGSLNAQATINFLADIGQGRRFETTASANVLNAGPGQFATLTGIITDNVGVPAVGTPIHFSVALAGGGDSHAKILETQPADGLTNSEGKVQVFVADDVGENVVVTVQAGTAKRDIPLYFGASVNLLPKDSQASADGTTTTSLTASVNDASGAGIGGVDVNFRTSSQTALLDNYRVTTENAIGQAAVKVINSVSEKTVVEAQVGNLVPAQANVNFILVGSGWPFSVTLKTQPPEPVLLSLNGTATIIATVLDSQNVPVKDGTRVNFSTNGVGTITEAAFTRSGQASAIFSAGPTAGLALVTATTETCLWSTTHTQCSAGVSINVQPGKAGIIEIAKVEPQIIGIKGSGVTQSAAIQFLVKDSLGNLVADGTTVEFSLGNTTLGGGETITTGEGGEGKTAKAITTRGMVSVTLKSGIVAGSADVVATVVTPAGNISTVARVTIVGSLPDADHLSLAAEYLNIAGGVTLGLEDTITAYVGDRFGNVVPDGTSVSFITEGGTIGKSIGGKDAAFTTTTTFGQATAVLQSAGPTTPMLGGIATLRKEGYQCEKTYTYVASSQLQGFCGNPGGVAVVAYTTGSESFVDTNGNGQFDVGTDRFSHPGFIDTNGNGHWDINEVISNRGDMSEPYLDGNDNQTFDPGELYIDVNNNGRFEGPDGVFQSNTTVWQSGRVLFSAPTAPLIVTPSIFSIPNGGSETFTVLNISDLYGNPLVKGSKLEITANNGVLGGATEWTFGDSGERGESSLQFTLASNPAKIITDKDKDGNVTTRIEYPPTESATITVKISSPVTDKTMGGNGDVTVSVSGGINVP